MSAADHITVVARWQVSSAHVDEVLALVASLRHASLAEAGCLDYDAFVSVAEPRALLLVERYRDDAALAAHRASPHFRTLVMDRIVPMLSDRQVHLLRPHDAA